MRVAQVAPLHQAVPSRLYGGTERAVSFLTEKLVAMGHDMTLFASRPARGWHFRQPASGRPILPACLDEVSPLNLEVGSARVSVRLRRVGDEVAINVTNCAANIPAVLVG